MHVIWVLLVHNMFLYAFHSFQVKKVVWCCTTCLGASQKEGRTRRSPVRQNRFNSLHDFYWHLLLQLFSFCAFRRQWGTTKPFITSLRRKCLVLKKRRKLIWSHLSNDLKTTSLYVIQCLLSLLQALLNIWSRNFRSLLTLQQNNRLP